MYDAVYDDVYEDIYFLHFEFHLIFDFILGEETASFQREQIDTGFSYIQSILLLYF